MLSCRLAIRTLHHSHRHSTSLAICTSQRTWLSAPRSYSSASGEGPHDEELDLSRVSAESAYLDLLLGPADVSLLKTCAKEVQSKTRILSSQPKGNQNTRNAKASLSPRRLPRPHIKLAEATSRRRRAPLTFYGAERPQCIDSPAYDAETRGKVEQVSQWRLGEDGQKGPTISVRRTVPAIAPASRPPRSSGVKYKQLKVNAHQRVEIIHLARVEDSRNRGMKNWGKKLFRLRSAFDQQLPRTGKTVEPPTLHPFAGAWAQSALMAQGRQAVRKLGPSRINLERTWYWQQAALWTLHHEPESMPTFLLNTRGTAQVKYTQQILQHLADRFTSIQGHASAKGLSALIEAFPRLADRGMRRPLLIKSSFLRHLMSHCSGDQIDELYRATRDNRVITSWLTWLHFATYLARNGQFEQALEAIVKSSRTGAAHDSTVFRSTCATLLRAAIKEPSGLRVCLKVIDIFVNLGVPLNIQLCNIVMLNAVEAGDAKTAFAVYNSLVEHGLQADAYTYAILLKGCKAAINDAGGLNITIRHAVEHIGIAHEPIVATEIIHCLALHHSDQSPDKAFDTVADAYAQLFDIEPLRMLEIVLPHLSARVDPDARRMQPPKHVVEIMIAAHLEHTFAQTQSTANAYALYRRFVKLADVGVQPFRGLLETDHVANAFMMTFCKTKKGLVQAAQVIREMQAGPLDCCRPTVQTWTIFLHGFTKHGNMRLAEQVLSYMQSKGMSPNQVTWNVLTAGYATAQDVNGTLDALRRMEEDGKVWDRWTEGGLKNLKNQQALTQLTQSQYTRRLQRDVDEDLKADLSSRILSLEEERVEERHVNRDDGMADSSGDIAEAREIVNTVYNPL